MGFFDKLKKAFSFEPENEENEAEKVADKAETEMSDANYADSDEETSKSELVEKKAQPEPDQAGEKPHGLQTGAVFPAYAPHLADGI